MRLPTDPYIFSNLALILGVVLFSSTVTALSQLHPSRRSTKLPALPRHPETDPSSYTRRLAFLTPLLFLPLPAEAAITRAVGSGEQACREAGNCLEKGEWDGAIGWQWGGKDRCDPLDPLCGPDGKVREIVGKPIPSVPDSVRIKRVAAIQIEIGREEVGVLKLGLYDVAGQEDAEAAAQQLATFLSAEGLYSTNTASKNGIGVRQEGVSLQRGGTLTAIVPGKEVEMGVPSQANAYARSRGRAKAGDDFIPQSRPSPLAFSTSVRLHDQAGLISIPEKGIGYGGTGFENSDECFESSFLITADAVPEFDAKGSRRRVVGQVVDAASMAFLERLANLPTKRGIRGVLPGQVSGPPLPKVNVQKVQVLDVSSA